MPTDNDRAAFRYISQEWKIIALHEYLTVENLVMKEIANQKFGITGDMAGETVSVITRCYGFTGKNNKGKFAPLYTKAFGGRYTAKQIDKFKEEDVTAFVYEYPDGCDSPLILENFLKECIAQRLNGYSDDYYDDDEYDDEEEYAPPPQRQTYQQPYQQSFQQPTYPAAPSSGGGGYGGGYGGGGGRGFPSFELPDLDWGKIGIVLLVIGIFSGLFGGGSCIKKSSCAGSSANTSLTACVPSKALDVNFDVGYFSDGTFYETKIVVDDKYYNYLDNAYTTNKFAAELKKGKHTVWVEYYRNGGFYTTDKLEFNVKKNGELIDLLVYPYGDKLILVFSDT